MKILRQKDIGHKVKVTVFEDDRIQMDTLPLSKQVYTIDLSKEEVKELQDFLNESPRYGMTDHGTMPIYYH